MTPSAETDERILVAAPPGRDGPLTCSVLERAGLSCLICTEIDNLCDRMAEGAGAAVILEEAITNGALASLLTAFDRQPPWAALPVILVTGEGALTEARRRLLGKLEPLRKVTFLERPVRIMTLVSSVRTALDSRRRQYEVRDLLHQLEEGVRRRDEFLAMLGHELRNPLGAMRNAIELLRRRPAEDRMFSVAHNILDRQTVDLTRLVDDLLDVARITRGKIQLRRERLDLTALLEDVTDTMRNSTEGRKRSFESSLPAGPVWIDADPTRLKQMFTNLLNNAIKYTEAGGRIAITAACADDGVEIRIDDDGVGMTAEVVVRVFDLFAQAERTLDRSQGGLGIGLTVAQRVVQMHGGSIQAASAGLGEGSQFTVRLPLSAAAPADKPQPRAEHLAERAAGARVLVVEDNPDSAESLGLLIETLGHSVSIVHDGPTALQEAARLRPDVVLLDIGLPGLDGFEVARRLRGDSRLTGLRLVALTGYGQESDRNKSAEAGFDHHLVKPIEIDELRTVLSAAAQ